ncbi:uncharacterized protein METZ01_LOCUS245703, partial [marine metagenome]
MMLAMRTIRNGAILVAAGMLLTALPSPATDTLPTSDELVVVTSGDLPAMSNVSASALARRAVLRAFLKQHPNYEFKPFVMPKIQGHAFDTGPLMGISSGNPPHAIYVNFRQSATYINHGFLEPLEVLLARVLSADERVRQSAAGAFLADPSQVEIDAARDSI